MDKLKSGTSQDPFNSGKDTGKPAIAVKLMLPDSENPITLPSQRSGHLAAATNVPLYLLAPVSGIVSREGPIAVWTSVPEAAIHEYDELLIGEKEIRIPRDAGV